MIGVGGYFDESIDKQDRCFVIGGYLCQYGFHVLLDWKWKSVLDNYGLEYFKASECESGMGEFRKFRDDPANPSAPLTDREKKKLTEIKTKFVDVICEFQSDITGVGAVLLLPDFERFIAEDERALRLFGNEPYYVCFQLALTAAGMSVYHTNQLRPKDHQILVKTIFDSHEEFSGMARILFDKFANKNPRASSFLLAPDYESDKDDSALQAADLLAFEVRKHFINQTYDPGRPERIAMTRLRTSIDSMFKVDYDALRMIMNDQSPDSVPIPPAMKGDATVR